MRAVFAVLAVLFGIASSMDTAAAGSTSRSCLPGELKATLNQIEARFGPVQVISAHRPGARVRGTGRRSKHADCRAVDFRPAKGQHAAVVAWLRANHVGGLGTYSGRHNHIHIDNGGNYTWHNGSRGRTRVAAGRSRGREVAESRGSRKASRRSGRRTDVAGWRARSDERRTSRRGGDRRNSTGGEQAHAWSLSDYRG